MRAEFVENQSKNTIIDETNKLINETIDYGIKYDYLDYVFPILSDESFTIEDDFFRVNKISPNAGAFLSERELKTISYLALFYKEKVKYNNASIKKYLKILGYENTDASVTPLVLKKDGDYTNKDDFISFEDYLKCEYESEINTTLLISVEKNFRNK